MLPLADQNVHSDLYQAFSRVTPPDGIPVHTAPLNDAEIAVLDVLRLLGIIEINSHTALSASAYYFVQSLLAHLKDRMTVDLLGVLSEGDDPGGVIRKMESDRLAKNPLATCMRDISLVWGIIKRRSERGDELLMQYDEDAYQFQLIGGKVEKNDGSIEEALRRELSEELPEASAAWHQLAELIRIPDTPDTLHVRVPSPSYGILTAYHIHLRAVKAGSLPFDHAMTTRWVHEAEIEARQTYDHQPIATITSELLPYLRKAPYLCDAE